MVRYNPLKIVKQDRGMNWNQVKRKYPGLSARGDMDNDGVKNYKDCRPLDPTQHGIFSAIAGAVSGAVSGSGAKKGWSEGMKRQDRGIVTRIQRKVGYGKYYQRRPESIKNAQKIIEQMPQNIKQVAGTTAGRIESRIASYHPQARYRQQVGFSRQRIQNIQEDLNQEGLSAKGKARLESQLRKSTLALEKSQYQQAMKQRVLRGNVTRRLIKSTFPMIPKQAIPLQSVKTTGEKVPGRGRGRPKGAWATEYAPYNGVYGYRKFIRAQNAAQKYQAILQQAQQRMAQVQQVPTQTGQEVVMQYQQVQPQQQYQQLPQLQTQQQPQFQQPQQFQQYQQPKPPIATVFRSYGGHPFKPVNPPLQRTPNSMYYEDTDAFSGERIIKQRPQAEAWIRPK